jgi:uncharacterized repeat protein (TIGR03803 family)
MPNAAPWPLFHSNSFQFAHGCPYRAQTVDSSPWPVPIELPNVRNAATWRMGHHHRCHPLLAITVRRLICGCELGHAVEPQAKAFRFVTVACQCIMRECPTSDGRSWMGRGERCVSRDGNIYGTASFGPGSNCNGTVFTISPKGDLTTIATFDGDNGSTSYGLGKSSIPRYALTNSDLSSNAINQLLGIVANPRLKHRLDVLDFVNSF